MSFDAEFYADSEYIHIEKLNVFGIWINVPKVNIDILK